MEENKDNTNIELNVNTHANSKKDFSIILKIILFVLVFVLLVRFATYGQDGEFTVPTFTSLFNKLLTTPVPGIPFVAAIDITVVDWGMFNFLLVFFNGILSIVNLLLFFVNGLITCVSYVSWFFQWLFML